MPVTGGREVAAALRALPRAVEARVAEALEDAAGIVLQDMKARTPRDAANPGKHAADGLTVIFSDSGLQARIGLPTAELASQYFWFRFLDLGTAGGEVTYRRADAPGKLFTMRVPARPALRIREVALDGNLPEVERLIRAAIAEGLRAGR
jgi:hypothetical protein